MLECSLLFLRALCIWKVLDPWMSSGISALLTRIQLRTSTKTFNIISNMRVGQLTTFYASRPLLSRVIYPFANGRLETSLSDTFTNLIIRCLAHLFLGVPSFYAEDDREGFLVDACVLVFLSKYQTYLEFSSY